MKWILVLFACLFPLMAQAGRPIDRFDDPVTVLSGQSITDTGGYATTRNLRVEGPGRLAIAGGVATVTGLSRTSAVRIAYLYSPDENLACGDPEEFALRVVEIVGDWTVSLHLIDADNTSISYGSGLTPGIIANDPVVPFYLDVYQQDPSYSIDFGAVRMVRLSFFLNSPPTAASKIVVDGLELEFE
jgi:hypothetical protein